MTKKQELARQEQLKMVAIDLAQQAVDSERAWVNGQMEQVVQQLQDELRLFAERAAADARAKLKRIAEQAQVRMMAKFNELVEGRTSQFVGD